MICPPRDRQHCRTPLSFSRLLLAFGICVGLPAISPGDQQVVVCLGDSITMGVHLPEDRGYPSVLESLLPGMKVINAGIGGNTSSQGLARFDHDVVKHAPVAVVLLFGTNDSVPQWRASTVFPLNNTKNLREMVDRCREHGANVVLLTLPAINGEPYFTRHPKQFYDAEGGLESIVARYRATALEIGRKMDIPVVDLYETFSKDPSLLRPPPDGVHPTADGCRAIAEQVALKLRPLVRPEKGVMR